MLDFFRLLRLAQILIFLFVLMSLLCFEISEASTRQPPKQAMNPLKIQQLRLGFYAEKLRLVFDSEPLLLYDHKKGLKNQCPRVGTTIIQTDPQRLMIHFNQAIVTRKIHKSLPSHRWVKNILCSNTGPHRATCVIDKTTQAPLLSVQTSTISGQPPHLSLIHISSPRDS